MNGKFGKKYFAATGRRRKLKLLQRTELIFENPNPIGPQRKTKDKRKKKREKENKKEGICRSQNPSICQI
jgi:hypothetical protein